MRTISEYAVERRYVLVPNLRAAATAPTTAPPTTTSGDYLPADIHADVILPRSEQGNADI